MSPLKEPKNIFTWKTYYIWKVSFKLINGLVKWFSVHDINWTCTQKILYLFDQMPQFLFHDRRMELELATSTFLTSNFDEWHPRVCSNYIEITNKKIQQIVFSLVSMHQLSRHNIRQCMGLVHFSTRKIVTSPILDVEIYIKMNLL